MRVGVIGINHKLADLKLREQLAKACQMRFGAFHAARGEHHFILLSTCNRTEVYFSSEDLAATHSYLLSILRMDVEEEFDHKLYSYFGGDCFCHLTRVTSGLDSAIIGETEIQGQVKVAYENAIEFHPLPQELHFLFQKSLAIAKKVRTELQLGRGMPNLEHAIMQTGKHVFESAEQQAQLLFVGASEINLKVLKFLKTKNFQHITLCNRSDNHACALAEKHEIGYLPWDQLASWKEYDWVICGTKSPDYLIRKEEICNVPIGKKLIMDLSVPRNVEPRLGQDPRITLLNIDQINRLLKTRHQCMSHILAAAEERVMLATQQHTNRYTEKMQSKFAVLAVTA